jgi:hypothetical protein
MDLVATGESMFGPEHFNQVVETLIAGQSPAAQVRSLGAREQRMVQLAQSIRGSLGQGPDPDFVAALHRRLARGRR